MAVEDAAIIELYWKRDETAVEETRGKYGAFCRRIAENILSVPEDAEECVNDVLFQAWISIPPERPEKLRAWLGKVVRNKALNIWNQNHARKRYAGMTALLDELAECLPSPEGVEKAMEGKELSEAVSSWLRTLPKGDRTLFIRRYWSGVSLQELAREQGISPAGLAKKMFRLRKSLKETLEKEGFSL